VRPRLALSVGISIALLAIGIAVALLAAQDVDATDGELITTAEASAEAQAFLRRYPSASTSVDRSGRIAVDFRTPVARLRVFIEAGPRVAGALLDCPGRAPIETNVAEAARAGCS
jgi:hypothetical protein